MSPSRVVNIVFLRNLLLDLQSLQCSQNYCLPGFCENGPLNFTVFNCFSSPKFQSLPPSSFMFPLTSSAPPHAVYTSHPDTPICYQYRVFITYFSAPPSSFALCLPGESCIKSLSQHKFWK